MLEDELGREVGVLLVEGFELLRRLRLEGRLARQTLVDDGADAPQIGARVVLQRHDHLRRLRARTSINQSINQRIHRSRASGVRNRPTHKSTGSHMSEIDVVKVNFALFFKIVMCTASAEEPRSANSLFPICDSYFIDPRHVPRHNRKRMVSESIGRSTRNERMFLAVCVGTDVSVTQLKRNDPFFLLINLSTQIIRLTGSCCDICRVVCSR